MDLSLPIKFLLAIIAGVIIGIERSGSFTGDKSGAAGGIRTFSLICLLGAITGVFFLNNLSLLLALNFGIFFLLLVSYYIAGSFLTRSFGITNELSYLYVFLIGFFIVSEILPLQLTISVLVVLTAILAFKEKSRNILLGISRVELESFIIYALIALVVLPFLPNVGYKLSDISFITNILSSYNVDFSKFSNLELFNPRKIWLIVVLVTGIDVFGYILKKIVGSKKGFAMTSFVAGFISSTSTTQALAQRSKKETFFSHLLGAALLANLASFFQIFLLVGPVNNQWLVFITPIILLLILSSGALSIFFLLKKEKNTKAKSSPDKETKIFSLLPALKFAGILIIVKIVTKISLITFGQSGFVLSSIIASFAGLDAILINLADMAGKGITFQFALLTFILVNASNLLSKSVYSFLQGSRKFAINFFFSVLFIIALSLVGFILIR